jgi:REP element-mobilizing transposase RayT
MCLRRWREAADLPQPIGAVAIALLPNGADLMNDVFITNRIRNHENFHAHCLYVRLNPVRAGFVNQPEDWLCVHPMRTTALKGWVNCAQSI